MKPIGKNIVIKTIDEEVKTDSGLVLSSKDIDAMRYKKGVVIEPGTEVNFIKKDDVIYYDKSHGFTLLVEDKPLTVIQERDVVVVLSARSSQ
jgi:co-chaperonin GroES (HSP10)